MRLSSGIAALIRVGGWSWHEIYHVTDLYQLAVAGKTTVSLYEQPPEPEYPYHDRTVGVTRCGRIRMGRRKINISTVLASEKVAVKQVRDKIWLVSFMQYDLGYFDHETCRLEPIENPFAAKVLPMSPV
jgi:hypothetical protein